MMDGQTPVIIDFDSCRPKEEKLGEKAGTFAERSRSFNA